MKVISVSMITVRRRTERGTVAFCVCNDCVSLYHCMPVNRFVVSCIPSWFWGPMVTLEDCLAAFFAADELKGKEDYTVLFCYNTLSGQV